MRTTASDEAAPATQCPAPEAAVPWSKIAPDEIAAAREVERQVLAKFPQATNLLYNLAIYAQHELAELDGVQVKAGIDHFSVVVLSQSVNAAWNAMKMVTSGYVRTGLSLARLLREGHIAVVWAVLFPDEFDAAWDVAFDGDAQGSWPTSGDMAQRISRQGLENIDVEKWSQMIGSYGASHNKVLSHAVSDFGLLMGFSMDQTEFRPYVGPVYDEQLTEMAFAHLVPLFALLLNDAAALVTRVKGTPRTEAHEEMARRVSEWLQTHPVPQF